MGFVRLSTNLLVKRGFRCISTQVFEAQTIGALTRRAEETSVVKIQEGPAKSKGNVGKGLLRRMKRKKINILANPLLPGALPYDESKITRGSKSSALKKDYMGFPWPEDANYVDSDLIFYEDLAPGKKNMKTIKKPSDSDGLSASLKEADRGLSIATKKKAMKGKKILKDQLNLKTNDYQKKHSINRSARIRKRHSRADMRALGHRLVSRRELDPYMPDWVISSKKLNGLRSRHSIPKQFKQMNKQLEKMNVKSNEANPVFKNMFNMDNSTFFNNCIYKNSSIKPDQKMEMINIINKMMRQESV
ncbi:hypothetical protein MERGE_000297 [Pneumocystis wakefieldiae]|uniref:Uncharacterized protein n=1 Tax=Pneumocystis wakefieldiae TaxID=38082 RepID=A0A899FVS1_9ASCO|nr:hypothetical protein MERGE_000297 [Pneumocystis wakefieldiae]